MHPAPIAITGMGAVSGFGRGVDALWAGLSTGGSAIRRVTLPESPAWPAVGGAAAPLDLCAPPSAPSRAAAMAWLAAREALARSGTPPEKATLCAAIGWPLDPAAPPGSRVPLDAAPSWLGNQLGLRGPHWTCYSACAASTQAIGDALRLLRSGEATACLVVGADTRLHPLGVTGYAKLGALAGDHASAPARACRPFDRARTGFVIGEGAGALVLETLDTARARGAEILGLVLSAAATCDAFRPTDPEPSGAQAARCLQLALDRAGLRPDQVDALNLHGTGTPANDRAEAAALRTVFGPALERIPAGSFKSLIGHLAMAAGIVECIGAVMALRHGLLPPNRNLDDPDPDCAGPDYVRGGARKGNFRTVLKGSFGFGGQNAAVVLARA